MIELRWTDKTVYPEYKDATSAALPRTSRVLQYRIQGPLFKDEDQVGYGWQHWQDVPYAAEGSDK